MLVRGASFEVGVCARKIMLIRVVVVAASMACSAQAVADNASSDVTPRPGSSAAPVHGQPLAGTAGAGAETGAETAAASQRSDLTASGHLGKPVLFGPQADQWLPTPVVATDSARASDEAARKDALSGPFWVFLLWYMGSR